jgi:hypothetical protein
VGAWEGFTKEAVWARPDASLVDWWSCAAGAARGKGTRSEAGLRQWVKGVGAHLKARGQGRSESVGSEREHRHDARQVFDEALSTRSWSREAERNITKPGACLGRLKDS